MPDDKPRWQIVACQNCHCTTFWAHQDPKLGRGEVLCRNCNTVLCATVVQQQEERGNRVPI